MARLDDLADLGVTDLWLSPITATNHGSYGYDVTDYRGIRPDCGTEEDLRALVAEAHARGLRVVMDFVPNHTSVAHPWFRDAERRGRASPYWDWYDRDDAGQPTHYFSWQHLPNLNFGHPEVRRYMLETFAYWVRESAVDGFRLDAVWGIRQRNPEWLAELVAGIRQIKPDALLIAEASARDPFYVDVGFDAAYDWTDALGHWAWADVFGGERSIGAAMTEALTAGPQDRAPVVRFLNNNDTGPRFVTTHGLGCYRVALAMLLTLPGLPCLFAGDEVGVEYEPYKQRRPIAWTDRFGLRREMKRLIALRRRESALHSGAWTPLAVEPAAPCFTYLRSDDGACPVVVSLNFSAIAVEALITLPEEIAAAFGGRDLIDQWGGAPLAPLDGARMNVLVPAWGWRIVAAADI
jgi:glycosidase